MSRAGDAPPPESSTAPTIQVRLHPDAVAAPSHRAALICREVVDLYFHALSNADLSQPPPAPQDAFFRFNIAGPNQSAADRRNQHERWILAKAFQDLMRGVRGSLEEAYFFIELISAGRLKAKSSGTLDEVLAPFRKRAQDMNFPDLLGYVNRRLEKPLVFADAYASLQAARNCLEHRDGVVGRKDVNADGVLIMRFPRGKIFVEKDGKEAELYKDFKTTEETIIQFRMETRELTFKLGEHLQISAADFDHIAFACAEFGSQLARQLPKSGPTT